MEIFEEVQDNEVTKRNAILREELDGIVQRYTQAMYKAGTPMSSWLLPRASLSMPTTEPLFLKKGGRITILRNWALPLLG